MKARSWLTSWIKPDDASTLHHECHPPKGRDIVQRIALHRHQVRLKAGRNRSDPAAQPERLSRHRSPAEDRVHRLVPAFLHAVDELLVVATVCSRISVGAEHYLHLVRARPPQGFAQLR